MNKLCVCFQGLISDVYKMKNFMPFGGGPRQCPGAELARMEMMVFVHHLLLNYSWELAEPDHPITLPFIEFPKGLPVKIQPVPHK